MPKGKPRPGAGRPFGSTIPNPKIKKQFRLCPDIVKRLMKESNMSRTVERALKQYFGME